MEPRNLHRHFKLALKRAGLPTTTRFHDLRHSCATFLIAQGVHPRIVMEILGHSQISLTMNTYGHVQPETQRDATTKIAGKFGKRELKPEPEQPDQAPEAEPEGTDDSRESDETHRSSDQTTAEPGEPGEAEGQAQEPDDEQDQR